MKHHHDFSETGSWSSIRSKTTLPWQTQIQKRGGSLFPFSRRLYCIHRAHRSSKADRRGCPRRLAQGLHRAAEGSGLRPARSQPTHNHPNNTPTRQLSLAVLGGGSSAQQQCTAAAAAAVAAAEQSRTCSSPCGMPASAPAMLSRELSATFATKEPTPAQKRLPFQLFRMFVPSLSW
jgi:hypothetical protein